MFANRLLHKSAGYMQEVMTDSHDCRSRAGLENPSLAFPPATFSLIYVADTPNHTIGTGTKVWPPPQ